MKKLKFLLCVPSCILRGSLWFSFLKFTTKLHKGSHKVAPSLFGHPLINLSKLYKKRKTR